jgi:hypothetical protein
MGQETRGALSIGASGFKAEDDVLEGVATHGEDARGEAKRQQSCRTPG